MKATKFIRTLAPLLLALLVLAACSDLAAGPTEDTQLATLAGTTYYVSTTGSNSNDGKSTSRPFKTIAKAAGAAGPGDTIYLRGGVYKEYVDGYSGGSNTYFTRSGVSGSPITIASYPGERATIDGSSLTGENGGRYLLQINANYIVVRDLNLRNSVGKGIRAAGNNNTISGVRSFANREDGIYVNGDNNLIERNESYDNYDRGSGGDSGDGIKVGGQSKGVVIKHNRVYNNSDDGIDVWDSVDALVTNNISYSNGRGTSGNGNGYKLGGGNGLPPAGTRPANSGVEAKYNVGYKNKASNFETNTTNGVSLYRNTSWASSGVGFEFGAKNGVSDDFVNRNLSYQDKTAFNDGPADSFPKGYMQNSWQEGITNPGLNTNPSSSGFMSIPSSSPAANVDGSPIGAVSPGKTLSSNIPSQTCGGSGYGACP